LSSLSSMVMRRAALTVSSRRVRQLQKKDDDVITFAKRTTMGRAKKGQLKDVLVNRTSSRTIQGGCQRTKLSPPEIDDIRVSVGNRHPPSPLYVSRGVALAVGIPDCVPLPVVHRLCS
ncbi:hypothetical protein H4582DRAFT_1766341, partial [Lactarius indigo]